MDKVIFLFISFSLCKNILFFSFPLCKNILFVSFPLCENILFISFSLSLFVKEKKPSAGGADG